jgi:hypothetical protein
MTDTGQSSAKTWLYRFLGPDGAEIEARDLDGDGTAESYARELSKARQIPVTVQRHDHVNWEYLSEADERD